jgi:dCTP deaminase
MILSDLELFDLQKRTAAQGRPFITPFQESQVRETAPGQKILSFGASSYGYDLRAGLKFKIFSNVYSATVDPKNFDLKSFVDVEVEKPGDFILIPPNSFVLTHSLEHIRMPDDLTGVVLGKSTYARCGVQTLCTPLEAGWSGHVTLEFSNSTPLPVRFYAGEGCCQVLFFHGSPCGTTYSQRSGKYQDQPADVVLPRV